MPVVAALMGLGLGSFFNVLIDRLPKGENVIWDRSHCDFCKKTLRWYELIPIISFVFQGGKCRRCNKKLSLKYPIIESLTALGFGLVSWHFAYQPWNTQLAWFIAFSSFLIIFFIDLEHQIIPDSMVIALLLAGIIHIWPMESVQWRPYVASGFIGGLFFLFLWLITRGRGMGFGDVKLVGVMGLLLGYPHIVIALYAAFLTGAIVAVILMIRGSAKMKSRIAFGPFLIVGTFISLFWTDSIVSLWFPFL
jgi:leader peptidase (prepilin peptidase)/N-methyltransferase